MASAVFQVKEQAVTDTPLLLFDCQLQNGQAESWSTHPVTVSGNNYLARVVQYNLYDIQTSSNQGVDTIPKISLSLANADSHFSELERSVGFKGAALTVSFVFFDLTQNAATTPIITLFKGVCNPPDEITESTFRLTAINWMNMQRVLMPQVRIQSRCPWDISSDSGAKTRSCEWRDRGTVLAVLQLWLLAGCSRRRRESIWQRALYDVWLHANGLPGTGNVLSRSMP